MTGITGALEKLFAPVDMTQGPPGYIAMAVTQSLSGVLRGGAHGAVLLEGRLAQKGAGTGITGFLIFSTDAAGLCPAASAQSFHLKEILIFSPVYY